jgi:acetyl esterase
MSFKLRLLLFYINFIARNRSYGNIPPYKIRQYNIEEYKKVGHFIELPPVSLHHIENREITMRDGQNIPIRIYKPSSEHHLPIIAFFHGGGFVLRDIDSHDTSCRRICKENQAIVVSVGYRLAPEFKFPIPSNDCYDATVWIANNAASLGGNAKNLIVMGDSAGGNLATVTAIQARDLSGPAIAKQVLIYPTTDARLQHPSIEKFAKGYFLTKELMQWFVNHYKQKDEDIYHPSMSPLLTEDLSNLPPTYLLTASHDPLKDEGEAYAKKLKAAGNTVYFKEFKNEVHGFMNLSNLTKGAKELDKDIKTFIQEGLVHGLAG